MRALTVRQPWASLIISGVKNIENRSWTTDHRGPIVITSSAASAPAHEWENARAILESIDPEHPAISAFFDNPRNAPVGMALGTVEVVSVLTDIENSPWTIPGNWHWVLANPRPFDPPVQCVGKLGLWDWKED